MSEDQTVIKQHRREKFTVIPNGLLEDKTLSWQETGLMAYLLHLPDNWAVNTRDLVKRKTNGRDAVRGMYRSLVLKGYLQITLSPATKDSPPHRVIHVFEQPLQQEYVVEPTPWKPGAGDPGPGKPGPLVKTQGSKDSSETTTPLPPSGGKLSRRARCAGCGKDGVVGTDLSRYVDTTQPRGQRTKYLHTGCQPPAVAGLHTQINDSKSREDWLRKP